MFAQLQRVFSRDKAGEASDWGIDDLQPPPAIGRVPEPPAPSLPTHPRQFDLKYYHYKYGVPLVKQNNHNYSLFIRHYLSLHHKCPQFWEQFRYSLIVSNLLDDAMILSKNDQALASLPRPPQPVAHPVTLPLIPVSAVADTPQVVCKPSYAITVPQQYRSGRILTVISLILVMLKQPLFGKPLTRKHLSLVHVLLLQAVKIIKYRRIAMAVASTQTLSIVTQFLSANYRINKQIISHLLALKHDEQFGFLGEESSESSRSRLHHHLVGAINFLAFNLVTSIAKVMPMVSADVFEQYCTINSINLAVLAPSWAEWKIQVPQKTGPVDEVVFLINKFNQLRKVLVCQLLSIEAASSSNFFVYKLMDHLEIDDHHDSPQWLPFQAKLTQLRSILTQFNTTTDTFGQMFSDLDHLYPRTPGREHEDVLTLSNAVERKQPSQLDSLVDKLQGLSTNVQYFVKYHQSTANVTSIDEIQEKLEIFRQFADDIGAVQEMHRLFLNELERDSFGEQTSTSSVVSSPKPNKSDRPFSLKSFHTSASKKRNSIPSSTQSAPDVDTTSRKSKRMSNGLSLGLLTVVEEQHDKTHGRSYSESLKSPAGSAPYDESYNLPPPSYDGYNHNLLEQFANSATPPLRGSKRFNRYSMNSVSSNISGLTDMITATQLTNYDDIENDDHRFSREELKQKLEESFDRIYNLESENRALKSTGDPVYPPEAPSARPEAMPKPNPAFLAALDKNMASR
ncbi:hypothetical protein DIURU_005331 [Diutina rugosa]|uniref:Myosin-binding domain-containing protein n=1 Tax=Diutina rugosa TaxID=5481 RepID=A0A642UE07_DIURU|nr:uncharacterized protein DIURU_005331 [Diutina rugosa]KAA8897354.1 hypothetical protein DIURU_005331 [Diutina rugosa]